MIKMIKKIVYKWKCPYCHEGDIAYGLVSANTILHDHMAMCVCNPDNKRCHSCIHKKGEQCELYNMNWLLAYCHGKDDNNQCCSWECRDRLKKIQEKLDRGKHE